MEQFYRISISFFHLGSQAVVENAYVPRHTKINSMHAFRLQPTQSRDIVIFFTENRPFSVDSVALSVVVKIQKKSNKNQGKIEFIENFTAFLVLSLSAGF